jgi:hypothetical protein
MAYFRDLDRCTYFDAYADPTFDLTAVGWLEASRGYERGAASAEFERQLFKLVENAWDPIRFRGRHACDLCSEGAVQIGSQMGGPIDVGATNLFVPKVGDTGLFVAPSLILHYVIDHGYMPPPAFQTAVLACPEGDSSAYFRGLAQLIPPTAEWRDGSFGYWNSMGAAIAGEAGLISRAQYDSLFRAFHKGRASFSAKDLAAEPQPWFSTMHLEPLAVLFAGLERQGLANDARAVGEWMSSVRFLGRSAPAAGGAAD